MLKKMLKKLDGNLETLREERAIWDANKKVHIDRHKRASWNPFSDKEHKTHTGQNILTEDHRLRPYSWAHLFPFHVLYSIGVTLTAVGFAIDRFAG